MRIFKNKTIFWVICWNGIQMGYSRPTDFTDLHRFFLCGLCGRGQKGHVDFADDADFFYLSANETYSVRFSQTFTITSSCLYVWVGVKGVYKNFCIYIVRKR